MWVHLRVRGARLVRLRWGAAWWRCAPHSARRCGQPMEGPGMPTRTTHVLPRRAARRLAALRRCVMCPPYRSGASYKLQYTWPGSNWRPSACWADVIATRPQVLIDDGAEAACLQLPAAQQGTRDAGWGRDLAGQSSAQSPFNLQHGGVSSKAVVRRHADRPQRREHTHRLPDQCCAAIGL